MADDKVPGSKDQRIHDRAYFLWEQEGKPDGRDIELWQRAADEIEAEDQGDAAAKAPGAVK